MSGVTVATLTAEPFGLAPHPSATFSDGAHLAVFYNGSNFVYSLSSDGGATWSAATTIIASPNLNGSQAHVDLCQSGNTLYGALLDYTGTAWQFVPFALAYASGSVTITTGTAVAVANISVGTANPAAGGTEISVSWDSDHTLYHVGVRTTAGLTLYALTTALTVSFSLTTGGPTSTNHNQPIVYVPSGGASGVLWQGCDGNTGGYPLTVNSISVSASAYGTWGATTSVINTSNTPNGIGATLDTTQSPAQPLFYWSDGSGTYVATYNGTTWTATRVVATADYGAAVQCVGKDLWLTYIGTGTQLVQRVSGVWGAPSTIDSGGDRSGWTTLNQTTGTLLLLYTNSAATTLYSVTYALGSATIGGAGGVQQVSIAAGSATIGGAGGLTATGYAVPPSLASLAVYKQQLVLVYSASGAFIDVWRDAPLLAGVKYAINSATTPLRVQLPRLFDTYDEAGAPGSRGSIAQGNVVQYWLFGPGLPTGGKLKYQGVIDSYAPSIAENGEESVTVTLTPFDSAVGDNGLLGGQTFGTPGTPASYVDPVTMFNWFFNNNDPLTGQPYANPLTLSGTNPTTSGVTTQYTFSNQSLASIFNTILKMSPANWFWRVNADKSVTLNVPPVTAQHQFVIGQHIVAPQYRKDWTRLKNVAQVIGTGLTTALTAALTSGLAYTTLSVSPLPAAVVVGQQLVLNDNGNPTQTVTLSAAAAAGATSVSVTSFTANGNYPAQTQVTLLVSATKSGSDLTTFGKRVMQLADNRVVDQNTAATLAQALINQYDRMILRTKLRIVDYRGDAQTGLGYDIESILPGDTCQIVNPLNEASSNLWDVSQWDVAYWDYSPAATLQQVAIIYSVTYQFDYVDLELDYFLPEDSRDLQNLRMAFQDYSLAAG